MGDEAALRSLICFSPRAFDAHAADRVRAALGDHPAREFAAGVAGCSPYLGGLIERRPDSARDALDRAPGESLARAAAAAWRAADQADPAAQLRALRIAKAEAALVCALAEVSGAWSTMEAAARLSDFADAAVGSAVRMALRQVVRLGFRPASPERPEEGSGLVVLAMGKLGARELNFSSDIDLIILFDREAESLGGPAESKRIAVAAARALVARLNDQTADGYVFRTDLRLRPDPGVSAAAVSINAAETYYECYGQNWERAAFIKARPAAGDVGLGEQFIRRLRPFVWRKYLDFAAIEEVYSVMRQVHAAKGAGAPEFYGRDVKRARGGIREIEFFVQAQQLIGGGKNPALRARATLDAMSALAEAGTITADVASNLSKRYCYLRTVEHRLQMIADEQTHRIPGSDAETMSLAAFLGEPSVESFRTRLINCMAAAHSETGRLFRPEDYAGSRKLAALNFSGVDNEPETIAALRALGFERPEQVADAFRRWQAGETRATRSARARSLLAKIAPQLIEALARAAAPDEALAAFDGFLRGLPAGVQIFSLFLNRPDVFDRLIRIMTISPFLAREVARRAHLAEALLESRWPDPTLDRVALAAKLDVRIAAAEGYEGALNAVRRWKSEENFSVAAQLLVDLIDAQEAAKRFALIADVALCALLSEARAETERRYGAIEGAAALIALGRLGAGQMTAVSDVDLMFIYDAPAGARSSRAALDPVTYYGRLVRRFLAAVATPTEEGIVYAVDMQLRPSGAKGPAAVSFSAFRRYYRAEAWTWEKMALTKARVIAGDAALARLIAQEFDCILEGERDARATARDVEDMRARLAAAKAAASPWDLKTVAGGFTELDFVIQFLLLVSRPLVPAAERGAAISALEALVARGSISASRAALLKRASEIYESVQQISRAAIGGVFSPGAAGQSLRRMVSALLDAPDVASAEAKLAAVEAEVLETYASIVLAAAQGENR
jgi:glutamate-ammonia-ligase adenylyltransferase